MTRALALFLLPAWLLALAAPAGAQDVTVTPGAGGGFVVEDNTATIERLRVARSSRRATSSGSGRSRRDG